MSQNARHTAILVFAQSDRLEAVRKPLLPYRNPNANRVVFRELNRATLALAKRTGYTVFHASEAQQVGVSFGERLANSIEGVWARGFEAVLVIGNDCPRLDAALLATAIAALAHQNWVLGPSLDTGLYLLGLHQNQYCRADFLALPWQETGLFEAFCCYLEARNASAAYLPVLQDLDRSADVWASFKTAWASSQVKKVFLSYFLVGGAVPSPAIQHTLPRLFAFQLPAFRAPPQASFSN